MAVFATICGLLAVVTLLALLADFIPIPYPAIMVLAGLAISFVPWWPDIRLQPEYYFLIFLPPLIYSAAWDMPWRDFRMNLRPILLLAIGFVLFTTGVVAAVAHYLIANMTWAAAVVFGAIVAPTDAIAARAVIDKVKGPRRVTTILEGESLVNDASGLTIYHVAITAVVLGTMTAGTAAREATLVIAGGIGLGLIIGWIAVWVHRRIDNPTVETLITLLTPYASFLPAQAIGVSGVLAVVASGLYISRLSPHIFTPRLRLRGRAVWNIVTFILNGLAFILIGLELRDLLQQIHGRSLGLGVEWAAIFVGVVMAARFIWVFPASMLPYWFRRELRQRDPMPPWRHMVVVAFTSMRGVISLAAALSLPLLGFAGTPFPARNTIIFLTFGVILGTLVLQSILLRPLLWLLGLAGQEEDRRMEWDARRQAAEAALRRLNELADKAPREEVALLREMYEQRLRTMETEDGAARLMHPPPEPTLRQELLQAERSMLLELYDREVINQSMLERIAFDLDLTELQLDSGNQGNRI